MTLNKNKMKNLIILWRKIERHYYKGIIFSRLKIISLKKLFFFFFIFSLEKIFGKENLLDCLSENLSIELEEINEKKGKNNFLIKKENTRSKKKTET